MSYKYVQFPSSYNVCIPVYRYCYRIVVYINAIFAFIFYLQWLVVVKSCDVIMRSLGTSCNTARDIGFSVCLPLRMARHMCSLPEHQMDRFQYNIYLRSLLQCIHETEF